MRGSYAWDDAPTGRTTHRAYPRHVSQGSIRGDVSKLRALAAALRTVELPAWLAQAMDPAAVTAELRGRIGQVVPDALDLADVRLIDVRARRSWSLRFDADVITAGGVRTVVLVADRPVPGVEPTPRHGGALLPGLGLAVTATDGDTGLPALPTLSDATAVRPLLETALREGGRPGLRLEEVRPHLVRYKPGQRATLVLDLRYPPDADPAWPRRVVAKTSRGDGGASTDAWMRALWESGLGRRGVPRLAEPLGYLPGHRTLLQRALPGDRTLADLVADPTVPADGPALGPALHETADGLVGAPRLRGGDRAAADGGRRAGDGRPAAPEARPLAPGADARPTPGRCSTRWPCSPARISSRPPRSTARSDRPRSCSTARARASWTSTASARASRPSTWAVSSRGSPSWSPTAPAAPSSPTPSSTATGPGPRFLLRRTALWVCLDLATGAIRSWYRARPARAALLLDLLDDALDADW